MNAKTFLAAVLSVVALLSLAVDATPVPSSCPMVLDGNTDGRFDLQTQFSLESFSANWVFGGDVLRYEWAIVSEDQASEEMLQGSCRSSPGFSGVPDTLAWTDVKKITHASAEKLNLTPRKTYFAVVRTTLRDGRLVFSNSNGMIILPSTLKTGDRLFSGVSASASSASSFITGEKETRNVLLNDGVTQTCPIDNANRCRQSQVSVNDILTELYGPAVFVAVPIFATPVPPPVEEDTSTTSDDDDGDWIAGIVIGALFLLLLLLLLLALLACLFVRGDGEDPFNTSVYSKEVDDVDADAGARVERTTAAENRVEFPDIDPSSRLSTA